MRVSVALSLWLATVSAAAADPVLFSNGARAGNSFLCDSGPRVCSGNGFWTIYDDFSLTSPATVTGFSFSDVLVQGSLSNYSHTGWSIWSSDPLQTGAPMFSGS